MLGCRHLAEGDAVVVKLVKGGYVEGHQPAVQELVHLRLRGVIIQLLRQGTGSQGSGHASQRIRVFTGLTVLHFWL